MITVSVVCHSGTGHTAKMAEAVLAGTASVEGVTAQLIAIEGKDIVEGKFKNPRVLAQLDKADAIIFGSPTYMGCVSPQSRNG